MASALRIADGSFDFSGGMDSGRVPTIQSPNVPNGLPRTMWSWMTNCTVRGGGTTQRGGFNFIAKITPPSFGIYQGGYCYEPTFANPYLMLQIGGHIFQVNVGTDNSVVDLSEEFDLFNPATPPQIWMAQGEQFLVIQAGDLSTNPKPTLPLFWDGQKLFRSLGIIGPNNIPGQQTPFNQLPAAQAMVYYQGRMWYAIANRYAAGDTVFNTSSGTAAYGFADAILEVTENPLALGGDGFAVPSQAGFITALTYTANLDTTLGQGPLYIGTRKRIYSITPPLNRAQWIATTAASPPQAIVAQNRWGPTGDRGVVQVNGDLFYPSLEPGIRSLFVATRYFSQWGNTPISRNINRVLNFNNRALMPFATGIEFDNRLLMGILPVQTVVGPAHQALASLDFDIISAFGQEELQGGKPPPAWEGMLQGLDVLQLFDGDFGGLQRAFAVIHSQVDDSVEVWEITDSLTRDNSPVAPDARVTWYVESPAYTWGREFDLKRLDGGEIWADRINGTVQLTVEYRVDADACWQPWLQTQFCAARTTCEDVVNPICYPTAPTYCEGQKFPIVLPVPPAPSCVSLNFRPHTDGYQFQVRITVKGFMRIRGLLLYALPLEKRPFEGLANQKP